NGASRPRPCPPAQRRDRRGLGARPVLQRAARAVAVTTFAPVSTPTATRPSPKHVMQVHMPRGYNVARDSITFSETGKSFRISHLPPPLRVPDARRGQSSQAVCAVLPAWRQCRLHRGPLRTVSRLSRQRRTALESLVRRLRRPRGRGRAALGGG